MISVINRRLPNHWFSFFLCLGLIFAPHAGGAQPLSCQAGMDRATTLNAYDLWRAAGECAEAQQEQDTNFLLIAGQVRAMTDMALLEPVSHEEGAKVGELYRVLFYRSGGSGFDQVYRDSDQVNRLLDRLKAWSAALSETYSPGWKYTAGIDQDDYRQMAQCQKAMRLVKLNWYAGLIQDDGYFSLRQQRAGLRDRKGGIKAGTEELKTFRELSRRIKAITDANPLPTDKPAVCAAIEAKRSGSTKK